ncbi:MAG TPA: iron chelate uptake ABC transporter family permease subunit, partial [Pyrinomonadaceae bacterium]
MKRALKLGAILIVLLIIVLIAAAMLGAERLPLTDLTELQRSILFDIRIPRILLGACVGASLAVAGAGLQALLRNPLAEPYLLGVSNGAALGTMIGFVLFQNVEAARPILAFAGAVAATVVVYRMAKSRAGMSVERLVLSGVIVTTFLSSVIVMLTTLLDASRLRSFTFWLLGDLSQGSSPGIWISGATVAVVTIVL